MSNALKISMKISIPDIESIKGSVKRQYSELLHKSADDMVTDIRTMWSGWKYKPWRGLVRPAALYDVSQAAWTKRIEDGSSDNKDLIIISNHAVDWRAKYYAQRGKSELSAKYENRPYVSLVTRSGESKPEYMKVVDMLKSENIPELKRKFAESFADAFQNTPKVNRTPKPSTPSTITIIE
jgi:hypothetical protein